MKKYMVIILILSLTSCCNTHVETTYSYNGTVIKRIDKCGKTVFYYNNIGNDDSRIWVEYSGLNDGFSGYLKFDSDGKVYLLSGDGYFQSANIDTSKFEYKRILAHQRPNLGKEVYQIELSTRYEKEKNLNTGTKVKAIYKK
jgi:hypothetical protein